MNIAIITKDFHLDIYGFGGSATNYAGTAFQLSGKMWEVIKANKINNKGMNVWVYEAADNVFAGVELQNPADTNNDGLEEKKIKLGKYAYYKHLGSYKLIKQTGQNIINKQGLEVILP